MADEPLTLGGLDGLDMEVESLRGEIGYIVGNPHTHSGRFSVLWTDDGQTHATSVNQLRRASRDARIWLMGFLAGHEPDPEDLWEHFDDYFVSEQQREEWKAVCAEFRTTGIVPDRWADEQRRRNEAWRAEEDAKTAAGEANDDDE